MPPALKPWSTLAQALGTGVTWVSEKVQQNLTQARASVEDFKLNQNLDQTSVNLV